MESPRTKPQQIFVIFGSLNRHEETKAFTSHIILMLCAHRGFARRVL